MSRFIAILAVVLLSAVPAGATTYQINYEGDVFPEEAGWERVISAGGADRSIDDGILTLSGLDDMMISDQYVMDMQEQLNPDPGEFFFAEWRMRLLPGSDGSDTGLLIATDGMERDLHATYGVEWFFSARDGMIAYLDTTVFRTYRLESLDMVDYTMFIDGEVAWQGYFGEGTTQSSEVAFGDEFIGSASASQWDYFRFGVQVIPEPGTFLLVAGGFALGIRRHSTRQAHTAYHRKTKGLSQCSVYDTGQSASCLPIVCKRME